MRETRSALAWVFRWLSRSWWVTLLLVTGGAIAAEAGPFAYVAHLAANTVSVIDTTTNMVVATVTVGGASYGVAITPDGAFAYVANQGSNTVSVIDTATNAVVATVPVDSPSGVAITPDGAFAYVGARSNIVSVIDTATNTVVATIPIIADPRWVAITPDGAFAYVTNFGSDSVSVIATASNTVSDDWFMLMATFKNAVQPGGCRNFIALLGAGCR